MPPLERFIRWVDTLLLPKLKASLAFYNRPKPYLLSKLKFQKNPLRKLL